MKVSIPLEKIRPEDAGVVGGKAAALARMLEIGIAVPSGICVPTEVYLRYLDEARLGLRISRELSRKPFADMRWEELWDAALRIRNMFLNTKLPGSLEAELLRAIELRFADRPVAVRSSAPGEDAEQTSFAGLHESFVNVRGTQAILDHVRLVWASLWSDRALLYRQELKLDVASSSMAVLIQELVPGERSGVAFSESPLSPAEAVIESVYGLNQGLVDGTVEPDRWTLDRETGRVLEHQPAERSHALALSREGVEMRALSAEQVARAPLAADEVGQVHRLARSLEESFGRPQDVEWTFSKEGLCALQARPITTGGSDEDQRHWYLTLTRSLENLRELRARVEGELIPEMQRVAVALAGSDLGDLDDAELSREIARREEIHQHWIGVYWDEFIPFAHGVRLFGQVYNDALRPEDPYEFMTLLAATPMQSLRRNAMLEQLADMIRRDPERAGRLKRGEPPDEDGEFAEALDSFLTEFGDLALRSGESTREMELLVPLLLELSGRAPSGSHDRSGEIEELQQGFIDSFSEERRGFASELLDLARASHQLRDDDNIHLARIEAQLLSARAEARHRLESGKSVTPSLTEVLKRDGAEQRLDHGRHVPSRVDDTDSSWTVRPRQLLGQPAGPGVASGPARVVTEASDLFGFKSGEILVCDAVQPHMTLVVPLAAGIVERRGGMLIHGAIIAREYRLPCVTGVADAPASIRTGDRLTVDGHLGMVVCRPLPRDGQNPDN